MRVKSRQHRVSIRTACLTTAIAACSLLCAGGGLQAQSADSKDGEKGFVWIETFQGTSNSLGTVTKLDNSGGYKFSPLFEMDFGVPFYFVHAPSGSLGTGLTSVNGIGDPHLDLQFSLGNESTSFISSITGTVPVGDTAKGLSTGRVTVDWNNYVEFTAGRISPFLDAGLANSISDTRFFTRPYTSLGTVAHFQGGAYLQLWRALSLGASAYADAPFGHQKVFSKLIERGQSGSTGRGKGVGTKKGAFESESVTEGDADIARDNGGSVWLDLYARGMADFQVGFTRSTEYDLNSVFFAVVVDVGKLVRGSR